jgi:2-phosphoglycerate kinase
MVARLELSNVSSFWLVVDESVLEERERKEDFYSQSNAPERMLQNFLERSYWYNDLISQQAGELNLEILHQDGTVSVDSMCETIMKRLEQDE